MIGEKKAMQIAADIVAAATKADRLAEFYSMSCFAKDGNKYLVCHFFDILMEERLVNTYTRDENIKPVRMAYEDTHKLICYFNSFLPTREQLKVIEQYGLQSIIRHLDNTGM